MHCDTEPKDCAFDIANEIKNNPNFLKLLLENGPQKPSGRSSDDGFTKYR